MPRDGSGNYTLPIGNPVVTDTTIDTAWANDTMSDIAAQLNNVITRDGLLGPLQPFKLVDGLVSAPGLGFNAEAQLGWYRIGTSVVGFTAAGKAVAVLDASAAGLSQQAFYPRTSGVGNGSALRLSNGIYGAANASDLLMSINDVEAKISSPFVGTGTELPLKVESPLSQGGQIALANGQCRLVKSGADLVLIPYNGNKLTIADKNYAIPAAGVSLPVTGAVALTLYYIYAYMVGTTMTLERSTTGHSWDATTGVRIKTGDRTRTLVGMAFAGTGPLWLDTVTARFVASYFNRKVVPVHQNGGAITNVAAPNYVQLTGHSFEFVTWADEDIQINAILPCSHNSATGVMSVNVGVDNITPVVVDTVWQAFANGANGNTNLSTILSGLSEGYHSVNLIGKTNTGIATWGIGSCRANITI